VSHPVRKDRAPVPALRGDLDQEASEPKVYRWRRAHGGGWLATC